VFPEVERVLARYERYWVVEKLGEAADVTEALDERGQDPAARVDDVVAHADRVAWNLPKPKAQ
jgi:hypothetical protein